MERDAAKHALRRRCVPAGVRGRGLEHGELLGFFGQELAAKQIGVGTRRICHLVDEALFEERILRVVDAAPHADRNMRVAHGEIDEIVRHVVGHVFKQALKKIPVDPELHHARRDRRDDGLACGSYLPGDRHAVSVETRGHPGGCHRAVEVVTDILLARPNELHRLTDLFRDHDRLAHEVLKDPAPAELSASCRFALIVLLETLELSPTSQVSASSSAAFFARHQLSATTATASGSFTTWRMPFTPASFVSSTDFNAPLNTGHWTIAACSIFGNCTSMA